MKVRDRISVRLSAGALALGVAALVASVAHAGSDAASAAAASPSGTERRPPARAGGPDTVSADTSEAFPHEDHAGLFALCTGCHGGISRGDTATFYPNPESCANCHDGEQAERVEWSGPERRPGNLIYDHADHAAEMEREGEEAASCESCHTPAGATRMAVTGRAVPNRCLSCHEHEATKHYVDASCATCHRPLAETGFDRGRIASLPEPADHDRGGFLIETHGESAERSLATCQTCHTQERCTSCHVEGAERETVASMPAAPAGMELPDLAARYPTPETHESEGWLDVHGERARPGECSTCHTRQSCTTCHRDAPSSTVARLPDGRRTDAPGVAVERRAPASHRVPDFPTAHGDLAAADPGNCTSCHTEASCTDCHAGGVADAREAGQRRELPAVASPAATAGAEGGPAAGGSTAGARAQAADTTHTDTTAADTSSSADSDGAPWPGPAARSEPGGFHPENFMARHASAAYGNRMECSTCHSTGAFCRECHQQTGMGSSGRIGPGFHDAQPLWLLRHGQAARQSLESCASCHRQRDCIQCHSTTGAFSVSPHGPDFDAQRYADRNRQVCLACHLSDPLGGGS